MNGNSIQGRKLLYHNQKSHFCFYRTISTILSSELGIFEELRNLYMIYLDLLGTLALMYVYGGGMKAALDLRLSDVICPTRLTAIGECVGRRLLLQSSYKK